MSVRVQRPLIDSLEPRRLFSTATPVAVNFNDEALWDQNFDAAAAQAKALGVQSVRLWMGFDGYETRPNAWDPVSPFGAISAGEVAPEDAHLDAMPTVMTRAFQLKAMGFTVLAVLQPDLSNAAESPEAARAFVRHLMDATQTPDSTQTLKDAIDYWEIGNEVDSGSYWKPSGVNKYNGLVSYVDQWLIPASQELHSGSPDQWEKVVSAGVSFDPNDLKTILNELNAQGAHNAIDSAGFHPYGQWTSTTKEIATRTSLARQYADAYGVKLIASEWNVRGMGNYGTNNAAWVKAMDEAYRQVILPNYEVAYYFTLVNNWAGRGGSTSARPGGLLKHDTTIQVTPTSATLDLRTYYRSPVVPADPFYSTFKSWQYGTVNGKVVNQAAAGTGSTLPTMNVFVDVNGNGSYDGNEPSAATDASGAYSLTYSVRDVPVGSYNILLATPSDTTIVAGRASAYLTNSAVTLSDFAVVAAPGPLASIVGYLWNDTNGDGQFNNLDSYAGARVVFIDADGDNVLDAGERQATSDANGNYRFDGLAPGTYNLTRVFPSGYRLSNGTNGRIAATVAAGQILAGLNLGSTAIAVVTVPPVTTPTTGSIAGRIFSDGNGDGIVNGADAYGGVRVVFLDANGNNLLDAGERQTSTDAAGAYRFDGLTAGSYKVTRVFPAGYRLSNGTNGYIGVTVAAGEAKTNVDIGSTNVPVTPTTPTIPTPPAAPTGTSGSVSGVISGVSASLLTSVRAYIDLNTNGTFDSNEPSALATTSGAYTITYPAASILTGTYSISIAVPTSLKAVTGALNKSLTPTSAVTGVNFTVAANGSTPSSAGVSFSGSVIPQISKWKAAAAATSWVVYLDTNKNGVRDAGETYTNVAADLTYKFTGITAGTYTLSLASVSGWNVVVPTTTSFPLTLKSGAVKTDLNFVVAKV